MAVNNKIRIFLKGKQCIVSEGYALAGFIPHWIPFKLLNWYCKLVYRADYFTLLAEDYQNLEHYQIPHREYFYHKDLEHIVSEFKTYD